MLRFDVRNNGSYRFKRFPGSLNLKDLLSCLDCYCNYILGNYVSENYIFGSNDSDAKGYFPNSFGYHDVLVYNYQKGLNPNDLKSLLILLS